MVLDHPDLRFRIGLSDWRNVANQVLTRSVDLGFAEISMVKSDGRLQTKLVGEHELIFYCRRGHPLSGLVKVSKSDLDRYPVATVRLPDRMVKVFPGKSDYDEEKKCLNPSIVVEDLTTALAIVMESDAFSVAAPLQIEPWLHSGELRVLPYRAPWLKLNYDFISLRGRMLAPAAEVFMQLIQRIEEELAPRNRELIQQISSTSGGDE